uniref:Uncharacterized protein n=1 Tax=Avena sativa TaxID=4498 RepID=A0ACD5VPH1_AVESA
MTAATVSSDESSRPSWVFLNTYARVGEHLNATTAGCKGRNDLPICASLVRERPPLPSNLYVHCSGGTLGEIPYLLSMVDDLILFDVYIGPPISVPSPLKSDFFIYRTDPKRPSLEMLPHPHGQVSRGDPFGIYPRGEDHYTIASLIIPSGFKSNLLFLLYLYDSKTKIWSRKKLSLEDPQVEFPFKIPVNFCEILQHNTSTVITLKDSIGWVDLWRGIVFCDMLSKNHTLSCVPLPLPLKCTERAVDPSETLGDAGFHRGIAFTNGCLRLVEVEFDVIVQEPYVYDEETGWPCSRTKNWTITTWTWTNKQMRNSYDGWHKDCTLQASDIFLGDRSESELPPVALQNLFVADPIIGMNEDGSHVIYLTARMKFMHPKSWVLAIDTRDHKVLSVAKSAPPPKPQFIDANYCTCSISK